MSHPPRRILTPGVSRKRSATSPKPSVQPTAVSRAVSVVNPSTTSSKPIEPPSQTQSSNRLLAGYMAFEPPSQTQSSNRLLAGYMAYEFLSKGTLLGQKFDPARAGAVPVSSTEPKRQRQRRSSAEDSEPKPKPQCYSEVAGLLRADEGTHIPGVVNPTQLARWIQVAPPDWCT